MRVYLLDTLGAGCSSWAEGSDTDTSRRYNGFLKVETLQRLAPGSGGHNNCLLAHSEDEKWGAEPR